jgi:surface antigen
MSWIHVLLTLSMTVFGPSSIVGQLKPYGEMNMTVGSYTTSRGYLVRECTDYVAEEEIALGVPPQSIAWLGNANDWVHTAHVRVDHNLAVGAAIVWAANTDGFGSMGHVALLVSVNHNVWMVAEMNLQDDNGLLDMRVLAASDIVLLSGVVHFETLKH